MMTDRERFSKLMNYDSVDRHPIHLVGPWPDTLTRWYKEGLPADVTDVHEYLGVSHIKVINVALDPLYPKFEAKVIRDEGDFEISQDNYGRTVRQFKDHTSMPEWIDFPVKDGADLRKILDEHFDVDQVISRMSADLEKTFARIEKNPESLVMTNGGGYYWLLRSLTGVEIASYMLYDATDSVDELFERLFTVIMAGLKDITSKVQVDVVGYGEDLACKTGPLISPAMVREMMLPRYKKALDFLHQQGVRSTWYDSDGDLRMFLPDFLSIGINGVAPCEVAANMDPVALRKTFGKDLRLIGGFDKRIVPLGKAAIYAEFERLKPVIEEGGFLPAIDHSVSSDISWDNYRHFVEAVQLYSGH